jgi:hypothetical protein
MTRHLICLIGLLGLLLGGGAGCKSSSVGRQCFLGNPEADGGMPQTVVGTPALECSSGVCLHIAGKHPDLCTADCSSDSNCETASESPCKGGFTCQIAVVTGDFCCRRLCICKDYLPQDAGPPPDPAACDPMNAANECCNLAGRTGDPRYPLCK